jgi:hypothetical protein
LASTKTSLVEELPLPRRFTSYRAREERDFTVKNESMSRKRKGKREYLNDAETRRMMQELDGTSSLRLRSLS